MRHSLCATNHRQIVHTVSERLVHNCTVCAHTISLGSAIQFGLHASSRSQITHESRGMTTKLTFPGVCGVFAHRDCQSSMRFHLSWQHICVARSGIIIIAILVLRNNCVIVGPFVRATRQWRRKSAKQTNTRGVGVFVRSTGITECVIRLARTRQVRTLPRDAIARQRVVSIVSSTGWLFLRLVTNEKHFDDVVRSWNIRNMRNYASI